MNGSKGSMKRLLTGLLAAALVTASFPSTVFAAGSSADPVPAVPEAVVSGPAAPVEDPADDETLTGPADPADADVPADPDDGQLPVDPEDMDIDTDADTALTADGATEEDVLVPVADEDPERVGGVGTPATEIWLGDYGDEIIANYNSSSDVMRYVNGILYNPDNGDQTPFEIPGKTNATAALYANGDLTIVFDDKAGFDSFDLITEDYPDTKEAYGIYVEGNLTIRVSGTRNRDTILNACVTNWHPEEVSDKAAGIYCTGKLVIDGSDCSNGKKLTVSSGGFGTSGESGKSYGIYAGKGFEFINTTVESVALSSVGSNGESYGIYTTSQTGTITNASVEATGGDATKASYGIYCSASLIASGESTVTATGGNALENSAESYGICTYKPNLSASGGKSPTISATGGGNGGSYSSVSSYGLCLTAPNTAPISISTGTIHATGGDVGEGHSYGINIKNNSVKLNITGGEIHAAGGVSTLTRSSSRGLNNRDAMVTVSGGKLEATAAGINPIAIYLKELTISGGEVIADASNGIREKDNGGSGTSAGVEADKLVVTSGKLTAYGPAIKNDDAAAIHNNCGEVEISGGEVKAIGGDMKDASSTGFTAGIHVYTGDLSITGGTVICAGGAVGNAKAESIGLRTQHYNSGVSTKFIFTGGTLTCSGGTIASGNTSGKSYGVYTVNNLREMPLEGTLLKAKGYTAAMPCDLSAGCVAAGTDYDGTGAAAIGGGSIAGNKLSGYKYVLAGTIEQMKEQGFEVSYDIGVGGKILLTGGVQPDVSKNVFTYNQTTNKLTPKVMVGDTDITNMVTVTASQVEDGKPAYKDVGTYTVTATVKAGNAQYTGTLTQEYEVKPLALSSAALSLTGADSYTYIPVNDQRSYPGISGTVTGKDSGNRTWTISGDELTLSYSYIDWNKATAEIVGEVTATATVKNNANDKKNYSLTPTPTKAFSLYKASALALTTPSVDSYIDGENKSISLHTLLKDGYVNGGTLSYAIKQNPGGCSVDTSGLFKCGSTDGECLVEISTAGTERYKAEKVILTINVKNKKPQTLALSGIENYKKTAYNVYVGMTSGTSAGEALPGLKTDDPAGYFTKPVGTTKTEIAYSGTKAGGTAYSSASKPTAPGRYVVTVTCTTNTDVYSGSEPFCILGDLSGSVPYFSLGSQSTYNGTSQPVVISAFTFDGVTLTAGTDYEIVSGGSAVDVGNNTLRIKGKGDYYIGSLADKTWSLRKKNPAAGDFVTTAATEKEYNGQAQDVTAPVLKNNMTGCGEIMVFYSGTGSTVYPSSTTAPAGVGTYAVTYNVAEGKNFNAANGLSYGTLTITKAEWTIPEGTPAMYNAAPGEEVTLDLTNRIPSDGSIKSAEITDGEESVQDGRVTVNDKKLSLTITEGATEDVELTVSVAGGKNYNDFEHTLTLHVETCEHNYVKTAAKAATCEKDGNIEYYTCSKCGNLYKKDQDGKYVRIFREETVIPAPGHDWTDWKITRAATDTAKGQETRSCKRRGCNKKETRDIPMVAAPKTVVVSSAEDSEVVYVNDTLGLQAQVIDNYGELWGDQEVEWTSSNVNIAKVNGSGTVTGAKAGTATITATSTQQITLTKLDGSAQDKTITTKATFKVTVRQTKLDNGKLTLELPKNQTIVEDHVRVQVGKTLKITPKFAAGVDRADQGLVWYSSDATIAAVNQTGLVTAKSVGQVTVTAVSQTNDEVYKTQDIRVYNPVTTLKLDKTALTLGKGESGTLALTALSDAATDRCVQITVPENAGLTVYKPDGSLIANGTNNGNIDLDGYAAGTAVLKVSVSADTAPGRYSLTATTLDGSNKKVTCTITVGNPVESFTISAPNDGSTLAVGKTMKFTAKFNDGVAANQPAVKTVDWQVTAVKDWEKKNVNDPALFSSYATVDKNGTIKALKAGWVTVTATPSDPAKKQTKTLRIYEAATKVTMNAKSVTLKEGTTYTLGATVSPASATYYFTDGTDKYVPAQQALEWEVTRSDKGADGKALVSAHYGNLTIGQLRDGAARGTATVKVFVLQDAGTVLKTDTCTITVVKNVPVTQVKLDNTAIKAGAGSIYALAATVTPTTADETGIVWTSSDTDAVVFLDGNTEKETITGPQKIRIKIKKIPENKRPVTITAKAEDGSKKQATCTVTVGNPVTGVTITPLTDAQKRLIVGRSLTLKATVSGETPQSKPANTTVTWKFTSVKNAAGQELTADKYDQIATINPKTGAIKAIASGKLTVKAVSNETPANGDPMSADPVNITTYVPINKLAISHTRVTASNGGTYMLWVNEVAPVNACDPEGMTQSIEWTSSDKNTILIAAETDTPVFAEDGKATTSQAVNQRLLFKVIAPSTKPVIIKGVTTDGSKKTIQCSVTVFSNVLDEDVSLKIETKTIAAKLLQLLTIKAWDGTEWISPNPDRVYKKLDVSGLPVKSTLKLTSNVTQSACDKTLVYVSSNPYIATVNAQGLITAKNPGTVTITLISADKKYSATCKVKVVK